MTPDVWEMALRLVAALAAGSAIGYERSYRGRAAGFRTHALVCMASAVLMLVTAYPSRWMTASSELVEMDPTRMAQGIMTGIGFLGAGAILKEGLTIRGLTTAASVWITAAIGILAGIGFFVPLAMAVALTLGVLSAFGWIETRMPTQTYYYFDVRFARENALKEPELRELVERHSFSVAKLTYRLEEGRILRYSMTIRSTSTGAAGKLAETLQATAQVQEYRISPTGD